MRTAEEFDEAVAAADLPLAVRRRLVRTVWALPIGLPQQATRCAALLARADLDLTDLVVLLHRIPPRRAPQLWAPLLDHPAAGEDLLVLAVEHGLGVDVRLFDAAAGHSQLGAVLCVLAARAGGLDDTVEALARRLVAAGPDAAVVTRRLVAELGYPAGAHAALAVLAGPDVPGPGGSGLPAPTVHPVSAGPKSPPQPTQRKGSPSR